MSERPNKAAICSVVFLDILDQSSKPLFKQIQNKELFNSIIDEAIKDVAPNDRIQVNTSDGRIMALSSTPEAALFIAMMIRDAIVKHNKTSDEKLFVRAGISMGAVKVGGDINGPPSIHGEGVNAAARVKNLAGPNQILVSRAYYDITSGLTDEIAQMFSYFHGEQDVYSVRPSEEEPFVPESVAEPQTAASLFSRLLYGEDSPRYVLWGSAALVAIVVLVGGFMLFSNMLHPDLGVVIGDSKPAVPAADLHAVSAASASTQLVAPETHEAVSSPLESTGSEPVLATEATQPQATQPAPKLRPAKSMATQPLLTAAEADTQMDVTESEFVPDAGEAEPEEQAVEPQKAAKKVAAAPRIRKRPAVEERELPSGGRHQTIWDTFRESFKQGRKEHICTQAEIALNQCK
jgi:hypothetical protein